MDAVAAKLYWPKSLVMDKAGNLIFTDVRNNRIRKITSLGVISTIAGSGAAGTTGGFAGNGGLATSAVLNYPKGLAIDTSDNLYFVDANNHQIRKIDASSKIITTVAGSTTGSGPALNQLNLPTDVAVDAAGTLYIADAGNYRIMQVRDGVPSVVMSNGQGSGLHQLESTEGLAVGPDGYLYIADTMNHRVLRY